MNYGKVPAVHICLESSPKQGSRSAALIHRAYTRLVWRGEIRDPRPHHRIVQEVFSWPFRAARLAYRQAGRNGKWVRERTQKSRSRQFAEMLALAVRHSIPPRAYMLFELYRPGHYAQAQAYLHRYETKRCLFDYLNHHLGGDATVADDKIAFERRCREVGLPSSETLFHAIGGQIESVDEPVNVLADRDVILKPVHGKGGRGIERWERLGNGFHRDSEGIELSTHDLVAHIRTLSLEDSMLAQELLRNHEDIADLAGGVLTTARIMTGRNEDGDPEVLSAAFRVAVDNRTVDNFHQGGLAAAVEIDCGRLGPAIGIKARSDWHEIHPSNGAEISGRILPDWTAALDLVRKAHAAMPELIFVGWDVAFTPQGPQLIEANSDPDVNILQRPHKQPLGDSRFAKLLVHHLETIDMSRRSSRSFGDRVGRFMRRRPVLSSVSGLLEEREVDAFVVSFPKCGRTWLRLQLGRVFQQHFELDVEDLVDVQNIAAQSREVPEVRFLHPGRPQQKRPDELSTARVDYFRFRKVILLVRDPRDVVVSMYLQRTKRGMEPQFFGTLSEFIDEPVGSFDTLLEFYNLWAERKGRRGRILIVRYEDMHSDPERELRRVLDFLGLPEVSNETISDAIAFTSFDRMKKMERENVMNNPKLSPGDPADAESFKTRRGKVGGYRDDLSDAEIASLEDRMKTSLRAFY